MASIQTESPTARPRSLGGFFGAIAFALAGTALGPATAHAADLPELDSVTASSRWILPPPNLRKRAALLGGPSRMEHVLLEQGYLANQEPEPELKEFSPAPRPETFASGTPNLFGTVGVPIASTPLDQQWQRASAVRQARALGKWAGAAGAEDRTDRMEQLHRVNLWVNRKIEFTDDSVTHGRSDRWSSATESLRRGRGDCEDFALAKMQLLSTLGFAGEEMYLVVVRDLVRQADHAVLAVELDGQFMILDNVTDQVLEASGVSDYRPIFSYSSAGRWVHGYAYASAGRPIRTASGIIASR